ncbi:thiamine-phosphate kinase [Rhodoferax sp. U11-2br]|uniref:thiamine-phosphate kinase n=1 Tax=Rhodoferax sp. U11-2br TaxID=2838878 RepID=UPI001BE76704|nr:thiamine-phosphate kinase [Rhodoferax sp. U11-2br]MBT3067305.1 thiamine-phosphate kinase [Rhodoferax sp. U11-2br]
MGEFDLIARYFKRPVRQAVLGVGDDCALMQPRPGTQMAISSDMLVSGRHFFADVNPRTLGHKSLAVNLSDLAACGARPLAFTLALSLPEVNEPWLAAFAEGLLALADAHGCELIGGDTTAGPLNICITVFGEVPVVNGRSQALLRSGAQAGDDIYVSGTLGDARLALNTLLGQIDLPPELLATARARLETPAPRVALGQALCGVATAAIDVSDGLLGDLGHILECSGMGACIEADTAIKLVASYPDSKRATGQFDLKISTEQWRSLALAGGDDYELLFTAPSAQRAAVAQAGQDSLTPVTRIGQIRAECGLQLVDSQGQTLPNHYASFDHFA